LSFLDERASLAQNIQMFATLPLWPFLQALARAELARERAMRVA
jgi:hypothetical protein